MEQHDAEVNVDYYKTYVNNRFIEENSFISAKAEDADPPALASVKHLLPVPFWGGHDDTVDCYWKTWEIAFRNLMKPAAGSGFVSNFIDTAFNGCLFMWDSVFILLFGRYGSRAFDFQRTLDNLYARQHPDGFICREIEEATGLDRFERYDPANTGPNVMAWSEWEYYLNFGNRERLARVFPVLVAYHQWLRLNRTWQDGTYWTSGWGCGMDNQPRQDKEYNRGWSHGHLSWADTCLQQVLSATLITRMAEELGRTDEVPDMAAEAAQLRKTVNAKLWDKAAEFYCDRQRDGRLNAVKSVGAYWALLAGVVPRNRQEPFIAHLRNPNEFNRPHRVPSLSKDHPEYDPKGSYWLGSVWPPTNYMIMRGLDSVRQYDLAHEIALNHLGNVVEVFRKTGTVWENYAPEAPEQGNQSKADFVGWSGLPATAVLFEYVFGIRSNVPESRIVWDVRLLEEHGIEQYPFGEQGTVSLKCGRRASPHDKPRIEAHSDIPLTLDIRWEGGRE
ncbi:MAG: MGH1-like glycoside hydrolase domain-containing protein, partial [Kiritimatiellia bacterium]